MEIRVHYTNEEPDLMPLARFILERMMKEEEEKDEERSA